MTEVKCIRINLSCFLLNSQHTDYVKICRHRKTHTHKHTHRVKPAYFRCLQRVQASILSRLLGLSLGAVSAVSDGMMCVCLGLAFWILTLRVCLCISQSALSKLHPAVCQRALCPLSVLTLSLHPSFHPFIPCSLPLCLQLPLVSCSSVRSLVSAGWF